MTMQELKMWVEAQVDMVEPGCSDIYWNPNKIPFVTFTCGGVKLPGEPPLLKASVEILAIQTFKLGVLDYIATLRIEGPKKLYWRWFPELELELVSTPEEPSTTKWYQILARFVITEA